MNNLQIEKILSRVYIARDKEKFLGVYPADKIPSKVTLASYNSFSMIVNTQPSTQKGRHWVSFYRKNKTCPIEFFDSFGRKPYISYFLKFLKGEQFIYNNLAVQSVFTNVCGQYCIFYILARHFDIPYFQIIELFKNGGDTFVAKFINDFFSLDLDIYDIDFIGKQISKCVRKKRNKPHNRVIKN